MCVETLNRSRERCKGSVVHSENPLVEAMALVSERAHIPHVSRSWWPHLSGPWDDQCFCKAVKDEGEGRSVST